MAVKARVPKWRRFAGAAVGLSGAAAVVTFLVVALMSHGRHDGSTASPGPASDSPTATVPAKLAGLPNITARNLLSLPAADAYWGQLAYTISRKPAAQITVTGATVASVHIPLSKAEFDALDAKGQNGGVSIAVDGQNLALVVWLHLGPAGDPRTPCWSNVAQPISWRILVAALDASGSPGQLTEFAHGENAVAFAGPMGGEGCTATTPPLVSVSDGQMAYLVEDSGQSHPYGSRILVRSLSDGSTLRDVVTPTHVLSMALSATNVAWLEADGNSPTTLQLRVSTAANPTARNVEVFTTPGAQMAWSLPTFGLQGNALAWERYGAGEVWLRDLAADTDRRVSPSGSVCLLGGIDAATIAMNCGGDSGHLQQNVSDAPWLVVWSAAIGPRLVVGLPPLQSEAISNGWIVITPSRGGNYQTFPVSDLTESP